MTITKPDESHVSGVKALLDRCESNPWSENSVLSELKKESCHNAVVIQDGEIIAYIAFDVIADEASIEEVCVDERYRRKGIATRLIESMEASCPSLSSVTLEVRKSNSAARALYSSLGFAAVGERKKYYSSPTEDAVIMTKYIGGDANEYTRDREQL